MNIIAPARAWAYLSKRPSGRKLIPQEETAMRISIVSIVMQPKARATKITPEILCFAAGYMIKGINGSHGPNIKIVKRIQGVIFVFSSLV